MRPGIILIVLATLQLPAGAAALRGESAYLHVAWSPGTLVVDGDTIPPAAGVVDLAPGEHRLSFIPVREGATWHPPLIGLEFDLGVEDTFHLDLDRLITVRIETEPEGSSVYRGGTWIGDTPLALSTISGCADTLKLVREGYLETRISPSHLGDGDTYQIRLLTRDTAGIEADARPAYGISTKRKVFKYGSLLGSVASISLGFWFKSRADAYYEDYLDHGNPDTIDALYDRSVSYDNRARTMFIVGEVLAGVTAYLFLRDYFSPPVRQETTSRERAHYERY